MVSLTPRAARRVRKMRQMGDGELLRVSSCCSGRRYVLEFDDATRPGDIVAESRGTLLVADEATAALFWDAEFDYDEARGEFTVAGRLPLTGGCDCEPLAAGVGERDDETQRSG